MNKVFVSYNTEIENAVAKVVHCMRRLSDVVPYFHPEERASGNFSVQLERHLQDAEGLVFFVSPETGASKWQLKELDAYLARHGDKRLCVVLLKDCELPSNLEGQIGSIDQVKPAQRVDNVEWPLAVADELLRRYGLQPVRTFDDLPTSLDVNYEKELINEYIRSAGTLGARRVATGYPATWPSAEQHPEEDSDWTWIDNGLEKGRHREDKAAIRVDARVRPEPEEAKIADRLTFREAGPRGRILYRQNLTVGVLVSGGIAPGINAVISAIVKRHEEYAAEIRREPQRGAHRVRILGFKEGFKPFIENRGPPEELDSAAVDSHVNRGGSLLSTARADELLTPNPILRERHLRRMVETISFHEIDILYVIGGEGSMRAAHALCTEHQRSRPERQFSVICVPKTMDNDILWVWQSFGFLSAVEKARENLLQLHTEVSSNPRIGVVQLFGSASGYVVSHAAFGSNVCSLALIPELKSFTMRDVCQRMEIALTRAKLDRQPPAALVVISEIAVPADWKDYKDADYVGLTPEERAELEQFDARGRKVVGQTPDPLRSASLKLVSRVLERYVTEVMGKGDLMALGPKLDRMPPVDAYWENFRVLTNEPRHIVRSMAPSVTDVAFGVRLGTMAVDMALAGYTDCMVSQWLTEYVVVPLKLVVLGRKQVPLNGIFWRTVASNTGQIAFESLADVKDSDSMVAEEARLGVQTPPSAHA